jgi:hypothetical protein
MSIFCKYKRFTCAHCISYEFLSVKRTLDISDRDGEQEKLLSVDKLHCTLIFFKGSIFWVQWYNNNKISRVCKISSKNIPSQRVVLPFLIFNNFEFCNKHETFALPLKNRFRPFLLCMLKYEFGYMNMNITDLFICVYLWI